MATKALDIAARAPRKGHEDPTLTLRPEEELDLGATGIERELASLIAAHGPDPDRIVALLAGKAQWERRKAVTRLTGQYGREAARVLLRSAENNAIFDEAHPEIARLRSAATSGARGHGQLLAETARRRAEGRKARLPEGVRRRGRPLPDDLRSDLERATGRSASNVRVVVGSDADEASRAIGAVGFTTDGIVVMPDERYRPDTVEGRTLLAHEAVHALQQEGGAVGSGLAPASAEREAENIAAHVAHGHVPATPLPITQSVGRESVARDSGGTKDAVSTSAKVSFTLGPAQVEVDLKASAGAGGATASANTSVDLDTSKLNSLLPDDVQFIEPKVVKVQLAGTKLAAPIKINAKYNGKAPYLKPVTFQFTVATDGKLSAKLALDLAIPGFASAKSDELEVKKEGITGDIKITKEKFAVKGVTIDGTLTVKVKDGKFDGCSGDAKIALPQGLGDAAIEAKLGDSFSAEAKIKSKALPGLGPLDCTLKWSQAGGFELPAPGQKVDVSGVKGLGGSVNVSFALNGAKSEFKVDCKDLKLTPKPLENVKFKEVKLSEKGLSATLQLTGVNIGGPSWLKINNVKGSITLDGTTLTCKDVSADVTVAEKNKGTIKCSLVDGKFKGQIKITTLDTKILDIGQGLTIDADLEDGDKEATVTGTITVKLGKLGTGTIEGLAFKGGHFTGKAKVPFKGGVLDGITASVELIDKSPWVKAEIDAKGLKGKKLKLPIKGAIPVEAEITGGDLKFNADLSGIEGSLKGKVSVEGGKLAEGDFDLSVKDSKVEGDLKCKVKKLPLLKGAEGEFKIHVKDEVITGGGSVTFEFEKWIKGPIKVGYDTTEGFYVKGESMTLDIPGLPFTVQPFKVGYEKGEFSVKDVVAALQPGKVPGISAATLKVNFEHGKLSLELTDVKFSVPLLKATTLSAKWDDGKWEVTGEAALDLPKGIKLTAKFGANNSGKDGGLNFDCEITVEAADLGKIIPGVEITKGKLTVKYHDGKLTIDGGELGVKVANGLLGGDLKFSMNADHTFNADGKFKLTMKFLKADEISVKVVSNELQQVKVTGIKVDLPKGKGAVTGDMSYDKQGLSANLKIDVTDVPFVEKLSATLVVTHNKFTSFTAEGKFKKTPGIDLSGLTIGGRLAAGDTPEFWCKGQVPIKGLPEPLDIDFLIGGAQWHFKVSGTVKISGVGTAKIDVNIADEGFHAGITITPTNTKLVKAASGYVDYQKGVGFGFGGSITLKVLEEFEGKIDFKKTPDGDFEFDGELTPSKSKSGEENKKKELVKWDLPNFQVNIPLVGIPFGADVHAGIGAKGGVEAGIYMPAVTLVTAKMHGKLKDLEKGELPDAQIKVKLSAGAYAAATITAFVAVGLGVLGAALDLRGSASAVLEAKAMVNATAFATKEGDSYTVGGDLSAEAAAGLKLVLALGVALSFAGKDLWTDTLASKEWALGSFQLGKFPIGKMEYHFGKPYAPPAGDQVKPPVPPLSQLRESGESMAKEKGAEAAATAKKKVEEFKHAAEEVAMAPVHAAQRVGGWISSHI